MPEAQFRLTHDRGILVIEHSGSLASMEDVARVQRAVAAQCRKLKTRKVAFDNRRTEPSLPEIEDAMRSWVLAPTGFDKVAIVLDSELRAIRFNMSAIAAGKRHRAFPSLNEAMVWLTESS